jgi:sporulation protein YlmC with PRC-barrel domain
MGDGCRPKGRGINLFPRLFLKRPNEFASKKSESLNIIVGFCDALDFIANQGENDMTVRLSKLFGMDIYTDNAEYKGKVFDLVINLEKGKIETMTTEPLKVRTKQEARKIIAEKSIPYQNILSAKDILLVGTRARPKTEEVSEEAHSTRRPAYQPYTRHR